MDDVKLIAANVTLNLPAARPGAATHGMSLFVNARLFQGFDIMLASSTERICGSVDRYTLKVNEIPLAVIPSTIHVELECPSPPDEVDGADFTLELLFAGANGESLRWTRQFDKIALDAGRAVWTTELRSGMRLVPADDER
jgi:hypothetical protein